MSFMHLVRSRSKFFTLGMALLVNKKKNNMLNFGGKKSSASHTILRPSSFFSRVLRSQAACCSGDFSLGARFDLILSAIWFGNCSYRCCNAAVIRTYNMCNLLLRICPVFKSTISGSVRFPLSSFANCFLASGSRTRPLIRA